MTPYELCLEAARLGLRLESRGESLIVKPKSKCPPAFADELTASKSALLAYLNDPVAQATTTFEGTVITVVQPGDPLPFELPEDYLRTFPQPGGRTRLGAQAVTADDSWLKVARTILARDFLEEPCDSTTIASWRIGLRSNPHPAAQAALARLEAVRPVRWGRKDHKAGRLLPRRPKVCA